MDFACTVNHEDRLLELIELDCIGVVCGKCTQRKLITSDSSSKCLMVLVKKTRPPL